MANQKTTRLRQLLSTQVSSSDWLPIVDVSEVTSPTGETKKISVSELSTYIISGGLVNIAMPYQGWDSANGLAFDDTIPSSDNERCYGDHPALGASYTLVVRAFVPSTFSTDAGHRVLFGMGVGNQIAESGAPSYNSAYLAIAGTDLLAVVTDGSGTVVPVTYTNFFGYNTERTFTAVLTKDALGDVSLYVNGVFYATLGGAAATTPSDTVVMGNGRASPHKNIQCTIYEAHVFNTVLSSDTIRNMFYRGVDATDPNLVSSYNSNTLNAGPTQWLDSISSNHILLPTEGAKATNPSKRFILSFPIDGTSQYLGNGNARDVLPAKYIITSCLVESSGKPLFSIGSSTVHAPTSASGTGSWNNNRAALVSASYGVNPIGLLVLGAAHADRTIYVHFSASAAPCTFSFDGYVRN